MSMIDTLFGLIPAASRGQQWIARDLQLVNWGGYDGGPHRVRFSPTATLLCGGSGSGKSTLMDAYIALLMPHTTPFNGASNGGVVGRPRGKDQRNILSYARGKLDESRTDEGTKVRVLRGEDRDIWTGIAMTWVDPTGALFSAVRAWYVPVAARTLEDVTAVRATRDDAFDLMDLAAAAAARFGKPAVAATGLTPFDTDRDFTARLHSTLGIGAAGGGHKAVSLLGRIQAGQQITTVDDLYKRMVLEEPETLAAADAVVAHFDQLAATHERMRVAAQQVRVLTPIREHRKALRAATERRDTIEHIGSFDDESSPAARWRAERRLSLLRAVEQEVRQRHGEAVAVVQEQESRLASAELERDGLAQTLSASGGDRLERARHECRGAEERLLSVGKQRQRLDDALTVLGGPVATAAEFAELTARARAEAVGEAAREAARTEFAEAMAQQRDARGTLTGLEAERSGAQRRRDNIPQPLHEARAALAAAARLTPEDLPFVGELVEVRTEYEVWREAINLALGSFATTMLIDAAHLSSFRTAIDAVRTGTRIRYEGVHTGLRGPALDDRTLPGRLDYRRTPFTGWLQDVLTSRFDYVCVETPGQLGQHRKALTRTGQLSRGSRGAHGGHGRLNVLGFTNSRLIARLGEQIDEARAALATCDAAVERAVKNLNAVDERRAALATVLDLAWDEVDVVAAEGDRDHWLSVIEKITGGNPELGDLQRRHNEAKQKADVLREALGKAKGDRDALAAKWSRTTDEVDIAQGLLDVVGAGDGVDGVGAGVDPVQRAYLEDLFEAPAGAELTEPALALADFDSALRRAAERLRAEQAAASAAIEAARGALGQTFETFLDRWPNPNLMADPDGAYGDFETILSDLETHGLHELKLEWRDSLLTLSGNDLTNLDGTLVRAIREIKDRIEPINAILADLPFADDRHRLRIDTQENHSAVRQRFRRDLRQVRAYIDRASTDADRQAAYARMVDVIGRLRRTAPDFADLVDVRNHVRVSAEKVQAETMAHVALYDHIGEKSGGESQELVAFIVGAALRYQLGDAGAARPRYAPVFLDEALIKADAHFTGRAIGAWRGLGFQLVIGAPNDKYSAIEPHVDVEYDILKDTRGHSRPKLKVGFPAEPARSADAARSARPGG